MNCLLHIFCFFLFCLASPNSCSASILFTKNDSVSDASADAIPDATYSHFSSSVLHQDTDNHLNANHGHNLTRDTYLLPHNISIVLLKWHPAPSIRVSWSYEGSICEAFRIIYHPITSRYRYIIEVPCYIRNVTIERLIPSTEYILTINPVPLELASKDMNADDVTSFDMKNIPKIYETPKRTPSSTSSYISNAPNVVRFISPQTEYNRFSKFRSSSLIIRKSPIDDDLEGVPVVKTGELCVVIFVLCGWIGMIIIFIRKWGKIRGIETVATLASSNLEHNINRGSVNIDGVATATMAGVQHQFSYLSNQKSSSNHSSALNSLKAQRSKDSDDTQVAITGCSLNPNVNNTQNFIPGTQPQQVAPPHVSTAINGTTTTDIFGGARKYSVDYGKKKMSDALNLFIDGVGRKGSVFHYQQQTHRYSHGDINHMASIMSASSAGANDSFNQDYPDHDMNCVIELGLSCNCKKCRINSKGFLSPTRRTSWALMEMIPEKDHLNILNDKNRRYKSAENLSSK